MFFSVLDDANGPAVACNRRVAEIEGSIAVLINDADL